jgi:hypothetical protein
MSDPIDYQLTQKGSISLVNMFKREQHPANPFIRTAPKELPISKVLVFTSLFKIKRPGIPKGYPSAARPSWFFKTRHFPSPSHEGFGFIVELFIC